MCRTSPAKIPPRGGRYVWHWPRFLAALVCVFATPEARAGVMFSVVFDASAAGLPAQVRSQIESNILGAGGWWATHLDATAALEVQVAIDNSFPRATGRSAIATYRGTQAGVEIYDQGAGAEIITGIDPNGATHDIEITLNSNYLANELWFDPQPLLRVDTVPGNRTDALSVFLHELGHALAVNGWSNGINASFPGNYQSTFDQFLVFDGQVLNFTGPSAVAIYGSPVPTTYANPNHLGNSLPRAGSDLIPDLMNGVVYQRGYRYEISPLDLAVLEDVGLPLLALPPALVGDANGDCQVGAADYAVWAAQFGQTGTGLAADFDASGQVGAGDYALWAANFGNTCASPGSGAGPNGLAAPAAFPVPAPHGLVLTALALLCGARWPRSWRRGRPKLRQAP